jgi:hypothetical protein
LPKVLSALDAKTLTGNSKSEALAVIKAGVIFAKVLEVSVTFNPRFEKSV